ncbi:hypothetical protein [Candidatus Methylobacter oryzae]|uniref:Porin n=1 Tax=Candidatus Methylobacter oryzae TaxID=2497749 RepID=A0ABY3CH13_9GAMM|nr:hypothetical protein [Candidatus Methylobacter oryzae]TRX03269.1 hypothetical protein EKO24_000940 [Candidatus Methylobacter oryzae]
MRLFSLFKLLAIAVSIASMPVAADDSDSAYRLGSGYAVGETGLRIGGYANAKIDVPRSAPWYFEATDLSMFITWDNGSRLRFFSELEGGDVLRGGEGEALGTQYAHFEFERFYLDTLINNNLTVRLGKFLTPIGQWNVIHAAPLVWTTSRPVATEKSFSTHASGLMLHGSILVASRQLEYSVYGDATDALDPHQSREPFDDAVGARLRYYLDDTLQIGASFANFALNDLHPARYHLAGLDVKWSYQKFELSSEVIYRTSGHANTKDIWQGFAQSVIPLFSQHWFAVGRYEFFDQPLDKTGQAGVLGLAYRPLPPVVWKLEYRTGTHNELLAPDGLSASFAILF